MKNLTNNRQLAINLIGNCVAFASGLLINFFLSPYIVKTLGVEANGFITLANNFVSYAALAAIALNSMAGRFITIKVHQNDIKGANKYYTSVTIGNFFLVLLMIVPAILCVIYLERIINIPSSLLWDVKLLFGLILLNFLISTAFSSWGTATFVTNKVYLQSFITMMAQLIRAILILGLFVLLQPSVYYMGLATLLSTIFTTYCYFNNKRKLLPQLKVNKEDYSFKSLCELVASGIWNTILSAGQILLSGLDLLIANLFIGSAEMGILSLAKTIPNVITRFAGTLTSVFTPSLTVYYAKNDYTGLRTELKKGMKITGIFLTIPVAILMILGDEFYRLWVPSQDAKILQILSILTCFGLVFTSGIQCLYNIFTVVNKVKNYSLLMLLSGIISTALVFVLLKTTDLGIFAVAGVSSFINLARNLLYVVPYSSKYLNLKWNTFIPEVLYSALSVMISVLIGFGIKQLVIINSWITLVVAAVLTAIPAFMVNAMIILNKKDRQYLISVILKAIKVKKAINTNMQ